MKNLLPRLTAIGDKHKARTFIGFANSQLRILENAMSFQNLKQAIRRVELPDGTRIMCSINHTLSSISILCPLQALSEDPTFFETEYIILSIVYGDPEEVLYYDLTSENPELEFFEDGETVFCSDNGYGKITYASTTQLYGSFILCEKGTVEGEENGATGHIEGCREKYYNRLYNYFNLYGDRTLFDSKSSLLLPQSAFDISPLSNTPCLAFNCSDVVYNWWSKTCDDMIVTAFVHLPMGCDMGSRWSVSISYKDQAVIWPTESRIEPIMGYYRHFCTSANCLSSTDTHVGFDIWTEVNEETEEEEYFVALMSDVEGIFSLYRFDLESLSMKLVAIRTSNVKFLSDFDAYTKPEWHIRLIGFGRTEKDKYKAYWCDLRHSSSYYEETFPEGIIKKHDLYAGASRTATEEIDGEKVTKSFSVTGVILTAIWNPISREVHFITEDNPVVVSEDFSVGSSSLGAYCHAYHKYWPARGCGNFLYTPILFPGPVVCFDGECDPTLDPDGYPQGFNSFSGAKTMAWKEEATTVAYNEFFIGDNSYKKGEVELSEKDLRLIRTNQNGGFCGPSNITDTPQGAQSRCIPTERIDYQFLSGVFLPTSELSFRYRSIGYEETTKFCAPSRNNNIGGYENTICVRKCATLKGECLDECYAFFDENLYEDCQCKDYDWIYRDSGDLIVFAADTSFPYDRGWRSILLHGYTQKSKEDPGQTGIEGWVIYKSLKTGSLYVVDNNAVIQQEVEVERAFFKQQYIKEKTEMEVVK